MSNISLFWSKIRFRSFLGTEASPRGGGGEGGHCMSLVNTVLISYLLGAISVSLLQSMIYIINQASACIFKKSRVICLTN